MFQLGLSESFAGISKEYQTPWQVNLIGPAGCGGTLVSPNVSHSCRYNREYRILLSFKYFQVILFKKIITAAHCILSTNPKSWKIRAGHLTRNDRESQIRTVVRLYKHPRYDSRNNNNDITVMIVSPPFEITGRVRPAALPREDLEITEGNLIVSGTANTETGEMNLTMQCKVCIHGLL